MLRTLLTLAGLGAAAYYLSDPKRREMLMHKAEALKGPLSDLANRATSMMQQAQGLTAQSIGSTSSPSADNPLHN